MAKHPLAVAALRLYNASPIAFSEFVRALSDMTDAATVAVTEAPAENIMVAQGRAQQMRHVLRILNECRIEPTPKPTPPIPR